VLGHEVSTALRLSVPVKELRLAANQPHESCMLMSLVSTP